MPNTKQLTACQMLREKVKAKIDNTYDEQALNALWAIDDIIDDLLPTERQQHLDTYKSGCKNFGISESQHQVYAENYFDYTFKPNK